MPHAAAQQVIAVGDKFVLTMHTSLQNIGIYGMAVSFGLTQKLFLSAFESAWATNGALNFLLIPGHGIVGAAWANGAAYAVQAVLGYIFSQRFYPIAYEWSRIARVGLRRDRRVRRRSPAAVGPPGGQRAIHAGAGT